MRVVRITTGRTTMRRAYCGGSVKVAIGIRKLTANSAYRTNNALVNLRRIGQDHLESGTSVSPSYGVGLSPTRPRRLVISVPQQPLAISATEWSARWCGGGLDVAQKERYRGARCGREATTLGVLLAAIALLVQIAGPMLHSPILLGSADSFGGFSALLDPHALCLAPNSEGLGPATPADKAPKTHCNFAACCFWHGSVGALPAPAALVGSVTFAPSRVAFTAPPANTPTRRSGTPRARAPPLRA